VPNGNFTLDICGVCLSPDDPARNCSCACGNGVVDTQCGEQCDSPFGICCNATTCRFLPSTTQCRASAGVCDSPEFCTETSDLCPVDTFLPSSTVCRNATDICDAPETCSGFSPPCPADAVQPSSFECRPSAGICDTPEFCDEQNKSCPADSKQPITTLCSVATLACQEDSFCDAINDACPMNPFSPATRVCRAAAGICDLQENCTETSYLCPTDLFRPSTYVCRNKTGVCDVEETCPSGSAMCPPDAVLPLGALCRDTAGNCDIAEFCDSVNKTCPADQFKNSSVVCNPPQNNCDLPALCPSDGPLCPPNPDLPDGTSCQADGVPCTLDECIAGVCTLVNDTCQCLTNADCDPVPPTNLCLVGTCEPDNTCLNTLQPGFCFINGMCFADGTQNPSNGCLVCVVSQNTTSWSPRPMGFPCDTGSATGLCSAQDTCDAQGVCVDQYLPAGTICRGITDLCDLPEECQPASDFCPANLFQPSTYVCRNATGICDTPQTCPGGGPACPPNVPRDSSFVCRPSVGICDKDDRCDGVNVTCPEDVFFNSSVLCRLANPLLACDTSEFCSELSPFCGPDLGLPIGTLCRPSNGDCDLPEFCLGGTNLACPFDQFKNSSVICRPAISQCDATETCGGFSAPCPPDAQQPLGFACDTGAPEFSCSDQDTCNGNGTCVDRYLGNSTVCRPSTDNNVCDPEERCTELEDMCPADIDFGPEDVCGVCGGNGTTCLGKLLLLSFL
jgi:hypothetical protein